MFISSPRPRGLKRRYSLQEKARIVAEIQSRRRSEARTIKSLVGDYELNENTFWTWVKDLRVGSPAPQLRPVTVVPDPPSPPEDTAPSRPNMQPGSTAPAPLPESARVLVTPQGYRVEGLTLGELAQLLVMLK